MAIRRRFGSPPRHRVLLSTILGGVLFGVGWATAGACPGSSLVQVGEGQLPAITAVIGILFGSWLYPILNERVFRMDSGSCGQ
jgi:uncharacterized membrane protein YedE/YeeE